MILKEPTEKNVKKKKAEITDRELSVLNFLASPNTWGAISVVSDFISPGQEKPICMAPKNTKAYKLHESTYMASGTAARVMKSLCKKGFIEVVLWHVKLTPKGSRCLADK